MTGFSNNPRLRLFEQGVLVMKCMAWPFKLYETWQRAGFFYMTECCLEVQLETIT